MRALLATPLDVLVARLWGAIDGVSKKAMLAALVVSVLAFGFEMTNLTLIHDDVNQLGIQDTILGHYLGRFGAGWLYYYTQNHYFIPFLQMAQGMALMVVYAIVVARFWGVRGTADMALVATILCVFPYMAHTYSYNTSMAINPLAHLLAALAVVYSSRGTLKHAALAVLLYVAAFSIYQSVAANAAAIFLVWMLRRAVFAPERSGSSWRREAIRSTGGVVAAVVLGGAIYLAIVSMMPIEFDTDHAAEEAFRLGGATKFAQALPLVWNGTKSFFVWPEPYFPDYLKVVQIALIAWAGLVCAWVPKRWTTKVAALGLLGLSVFAPRVLQLVHPAGTYHALALTGYAVVIAGAVSIVTSGVGNAARNVALLAGVFLTAGYVLQCNWISTVNYLNTTAHFNTLTQVLARLRSLPRADWDGKKVVVVGRYDMPSDYPFKLSTGVANKYMDPEHMTSVARILRDEATFVAADQRTPKVLEYAATHPTWPHPDSVTVIDGAGVVVFAKTPSAPQ